MKLRYLISILFAIFISANIYAISKNKTTPDLALFELKGPVKSVSKGFLMGIDEVGCKYNINGRLIKVNKPNYINSKGIIFKRDKYNYIDQLWGEPIGEEDIFKYLNRIEYGHNGFLQKITYNEEGYEQTITDIKYKNHLISQYTQIEENFYEEETTFATISFKYTQFDKYGNWISRIATITRFQDKLAYRYNSPYSSESKKQTRTITYFQ